ncbi:MAG TPA: cytochrome o ubiquinol oxidase subunit I, partial [Noviherbaspirillum sp.]
FTPRVYDNDTWSDMKRRSYTRPRDGFIAIHMPKNTAAGFVIAALSALTGFALIWQMWLVAGIGFAATVIAAIVHTFNYKRDYYIPAEDVVRTEAARTRQLENLAHV